MRKRSLLFFVAIIATVCFSLGFFAACGGNNGSGSDDNGGTGGGDNPSGHTHSYVETVISPTCTEKGYTLHKCACGYEFLDNLTAALGHNLGEWKVTTPATEGKDGEETRACTRENCDYFETRKIPAQEHTHDYKETVVEPTCTEKGYTLHKCSCGDEYKDNEQPALGHSFTNYVSDGNATCTKDGTKTAKCDRCDEKDTVTDEKTAFGHNFGEWKEIKPATEEEDGLKERACARCGETEEQSIPAKTHEHKYVETVIEPTCTERGYTLHKCACGDEYKDNETEALGHSFTNYISDGNATCTKDGTKTAKCDRCDERDTVTDEKTALGHNFSTEWTVDKKATCQKTGIKSHHCTRCEAKTDETEVPIIDHNYVDEICSMCGKVELIEATGLEYTLSDDKTYYIVTELGECTRKHFIIPATYNGLPVKEIGEMVFYQKNDIIQVVLPDGIEKIGNGAFSGCSSLRVIYLGNVLQTIGDSAFSGCRSLTSITIPDSVTSIGRRVFYCCSSLTSINIPDGVTSIGGWAFSDCYSLTSITIPDSVTNIGEDAFYCCSSLMSIAIPDSVTSIGNEAFSGCNKLIKTIKGVGYVDKWVIDCDTSVTKVELKADTVGIAYSAFSGCRSLTSITIPDSVTNIGGSAFYNCSSLTSITIPDGVTSIGSSAFYGCSSLTSITIPDGVMCIESVVFFYCSSLTDITYNGTKAEWQKITKGDGWKWNTGNFTVHCTDGDLTKNEA